MTSRLSEDDDWQYLPIEYSRAVAAAGGIPVQIPLLSQAAKELMKHLDGVIICGSGSDVDPSRYHQGRHPAVKSIHRDLDETGFQILECAFRDSTPVLGICYGVQLLNVFLDGTLIQHIPECVPGAMEHQDRRALHPITIIEGTQLHAWAGPSTEAVVNSTHHQSIQKPGRNLMVSARTSDGIIEGVEGTNPEHFVVGVQWHPERLHRTETLSGRLFRELVRSAIERRDALLDIPRVAINS